MFETVTPYAPPREMGEHERLTIAQMVECTGANQNTVKVRLRELVNEGRIQQYGKARATWYCLV